MLLDQAMPSKRASELLQQTTFGETTQDDGAEAK